MRGAIFASSQFPLPFGERLEHLCDGNVGVVIGLVQQEMRIVISSHLMLFQTFSCFQNVGLCFLQEMFCRKKYVLKV